jgi:4-carboxymuconolactone decarboxylase
MERIDRTRETYRKLFGGEPVSGEGPDPELMQILQRFIFGEVFFAGNLDDTLRELITIVTLTTQQALPQLHAHTHAALNVGASALAIREAIYLCAPFIGFPRTLNGVSTINEVFAQRDIPLPLEPQGTVTEENRLEEGRRLQQALYGNEIRERLSHLPGDLGAQTAGFLTGLCFGDFYTRGELRIETRELLALIALVTMGAGEQVRAHLRGCVKAGNSIETIAAAIVHTIPYVGFPNALNALYAMEQIDHG